MQADIGARSNPLHVQQPLAMAPRPRLTTCVPKRCIAESYMIVPTWATIRLFFSRTFRTRLLSFLFDGILCRPANRRIQLLLINCRRTRTALRGTPRKRPAQREPASRSLLFRSDFMDLGFKCLLSNVHHKCRDENGGAGHDKQEEHDLLKGVQIREVDGVEACQRHGAHAEEQGVGETDAPGRRGSAPEDDGRHETCDEEIRIVQGDEVQRGQVAAYDARNPPDRAAEGGSDSSVWLHHPECGCGSCPETSSCGGDVLNCRVCSGSRSAARQS